MILDIPPTTAQLIHNVAAKHGLSVNDWLLSVATERQNTDQTTINPMIARAISLPSPTSYADCDAVELQRQWRDEWSLSVIGRINCTDRDLSLADYMGQFEPLANFQDIDPVAYQGQVRDEWH